VTDVGELHDRLREIAATDSIDTSLERDEIDRRARRYRRQRRRVALAFAALGVAGLIIVVSALASGGEGGQSVRVPPAQTGSNEPTDTNAPGPKRFDTNGVLDANGNAQHVRVGVGDGTGTVRGYTWLDEWVTIPSTNILAQEVRADDGRLTGYLLDNIGFVPMSQVENGMVKRAPECFAALQSLAHGGPELDAGCQSLLVASGHPIPHAPTTTTAR
jgi:hypothetical protein